MRRPTGDGAGRLVGRVAVVTGAGGGIGRAVCAALASEGATVVVADVDHAGVERTVRDLPEGALGLTADVAREPDMAEMTRRTLERFGRIDVLVACAVILVGCNCLPYPLTEITVD